MKTIQPSSLTCSITLQTCKGEDIILGGDYNLVLDLDKDKRGGLSKTHENSVKIVQEFSDKLDLVDIWMVLKPDSNSFTWIQRHPRMQCRLDFFLVSQSTANITTSADIVPGYKTALSMITVHFATFNSTWSRFLETKYIFFS